MYKVTGIRMSPRSESIVRKKSFMQEIVYFLLLLFIRSNSMFAFVKHEKLLGMSWHSLTPSLIKILIGYYKINKISSKYLKFISFSGSRILY